MKNALRSFGSTLIACFVVVLVCLSQLLFASIYQSVTYNYWFPNFAFHVYSAACCLMVELAFFYESSKDPFSTLLGVVIVGAACFFEYQKIALYGAMDQNLRWVYLAGLVLTLLRLAYDLYHRFKKGFKNPYDRPNYNGPAYHIEKAEDMDATTLTKETQDDTHSGKPVA